MRPGAELSVLYYSDLVFNRVRLLGGEPHTRTHFFPVCSTKKKAEGAFMEAIIFPNHITSIYSTITEESNIVLKLSKVVADLFSSTVDSSPSILFLADNLLSLPFRFDSLPVFLQQTILLRDVRYFGTRHAYTNGSNRNFR